VEEESEVDAQSQFMDPIPESAFNGVSSMGLAGTQYFTPVKDSETPSLHDRFPEMTQFELLEASPATCISDLMRADL
jgi:hypothetical protein